MDLIDLASRGWALRYLREAKAELKLAREEPKLTLLFSLEAARKAQACIYHCLGSADSLEMLVLDAMMSNTVARDKVMEILLMAERLVQAVSEAEDPRQAYRLASRAVRLASKVVEKVLGEIGS